MGVMQSTNERDRRGLDPLSVEPRGGERARLHWRRIVLAQYGAAGCWLGRCLAGLTLVAHGDSSPILACSSEPMPGDLKHTSISAFSACGTFLALFFHPPPPRSSTL